MINPFERLFAKALEIPREDLGPDRYHDHIQARLESANRSQLLQIYKMGSELFRYTEDNRKRHVRALQRAADEAQQLVQELEEANAQKLDTLTRLAELVASLGVSAETETRSGGLDALVGQIKELVESQKRHTAEIDEARWVAVEAAEARSRFLANMSHEIRTPMNGIMGTLNLLSEERLGEEDRQYLEVVRRSTRALITVLNDILDFSRLQEGGVEISNAPLSLHDLCRDVQNIFRLAAEGKGIDLQLHLDEELPATVSGDETRLRQILNNLVGNATKFTEAGVVQIRVSARTDRLIFEISDTGIGMGPEAISRLFSPFRQGDDSITRRFGGTGLGLSISQNLAELMGGRIRVRSEAGKGSTFTFQLPLEALPESAGGSRRRPKAESSLLKKVPPEDRLRVLVAEDNSINQLVARKSLERMGHRVTIASDGREAVGHAARADFDVVLMDLQMPVMDGIEAAGKIRQLPGRRGRLPIFAMTGHVMDESRRACAEAGVNGFIPKPFDLLTLRDTLEGCLDSGR